MQGTLRNRPAGDWHGDAPCAASHLAEQGLWHPPGVAALLRALDALQLFDNRLTGTLPRGLKAARECALTVADPAFPPPRPPAPPPAPLLLLLASAPEGRSAAARCEWKKDAVGPAPAVGGREASSAAARASS
mmetsp:Transcript_10147/g.32152  ORF Transcript_10147/g.32152 Transcript_10147/m.32152 type:complete len:133 (-) Transcript_10147:610-1008(-)